MEYQNSDHRYMRIQYVIKVPSQIYGENMVHLINGIVITDKHFRGKHLVSIATPGPNKFIWTSDLHI